MQLDQDKRGFSFLREGPLDMRMNKKSSLTAEEIVNHWSEQELGELFRDLGEERKWQTAANAVVRARRKKPFTTTTELADTIEKAIAPNGRGKLHPATKIFQAVRICVNRELDSIAVGLKKMLEHLKGRGVVISFHSFEDRLVKNIFRDAAKPFKEMGEFEKKRLFHLITKKPLVPTREETKKNKRARSAKMRAIAKGD